jgi:isoleucyl-tRNA synthetase
VAEDLKQTVFQECGLKEKSQVMTFYGRDIEYSFFEHPFLYGMQSQFPLNHVVYAVRARHVTLDAGSGIVHTAPGHGAEDFALTAEYTDLKVYAPLDDRGRFTEGLPEYKGLNVFEANAVIVQLLRDRGALLKVSEYKHSYPHCWRCHNPVIFRATEQWFIKMDQAGKGRQKTLRQEALEEIHGVKWIPAWGEDRMYEMVEKRPDWCVSRQRFWGVPIIVFYCDGCGKRLEDYAALRNVVKLFEKEGADAWYKHSPEELLPSGTKCACGASKWRKENDILDVWFDSGSSHLSVLKGPEWPADVYLEGLDQYRGWFQSSLLVATGTRDAAPYRGIVTHGWTLDEQGRPMSKSLGNAISPNEICERWGADLLRLWVASVEYQADVKMSERVMTQLSEAYRKIRNTFRFALSNLGNFDPNQDSVNDAELLDLDAWMLGRTDALAQQCYTPKSELLPAQGWYEGYEFHRVFHALYNFTAVDLSAFYFDVLKDRLYTFAPGNRARRSAQTVVYKIARALVRLLAPILVFTSEELWKYMPRLKGDPESVHMTLFPKVGELATGERYLKLRQEWEDLAEVRTSVLVKLEEARNSKQIAGSLEAKVILASGLPKRQDLLKAHLKDLPALFIVSQVEVQEGPLKEATGGHGLPDLAIIVKKADGKKCERCWNYSTHVGENSRYPTVCERCSVALAEIERDGSAGVAAT